LLVDQIKPLWKEAWQVSILSVAGVQTPYASSDQELRKAVNQGPFKQTTITSAARNLSRFFGRRVIFLITDAGAPADRKVIMATQRAGAMLYHVGGDPWKNKQLAYGETGSLGAHASETIAAAGGQQDAPYFYNYRIYGRPIEERNFSGARKDSVHDGIGYYDLKLNGPPSASSLSLSIDIVDPFSDKARYQVHALPYAEGRTPPNVVVVSAR
jgi:hypothetical protein